MFCFSRSYICYIDICPFNSYFSALLILQYFSFMWQGIFVLVLVGRRRRKWCMWPQKMQVTNCVRLDICLGLSLTEFMKVPVFSPNTSLFLPPNFPPRVWQTRDIALWGGCQGPTFQEENSDFDWCPGRGEAETEEQAFTEGSTSLWHYYSMYELKFWSLGFLSTSRSFNEEQEQTDTNNTNDSGRIIWTN